MHFVVALSSTKEKVAPMMPGEARLKKRGLDCKEPLSSAGGVIQGGQMVTESQHTIEEKNCLLTLSALLLSLASKLEQSQYQIVPSINVIIFQCQGTCRLHHCLGVVEPGQMSSRGAVSVTQNTRVCREIQKENTG
jgi:hypothetical protein